MASRSCPVCCAPWLGEGLLLLLLLLLLLCEWFTRIGLVSPPAATCHLYPMTLT